MFPRCSLAGLPLFSPNASLEDAGDQQAVIPPPAQFAGNESSVQPPGSQPLFKSTVVYKPTPAASNAPPLGPAALSSGGLVDAEQLRLQLRRNSASAAAVSAAFGAGAPSRAAPPPAQPVVNGGASGTGPGQGQGQAPKMANGTVPTGRGLGGDAAGIGGNGTGLPAAAGPSASPVSIKPSNLFGSVRGTPSAEQQRPGTAQAAFEPPRDYEFGANASGEEGAQRGDRNARSSSAQRVGLPPPDYDQPSKNQFAGARNQSVPARGRRTSALFFMASWVFVPNIVDCTSTSRDFIAPH